MTPKLIGLTGKMGAGKDECLKRLRVVSSDLSFKQLSFADPLKRSVAALLDVTVKQLEEWKRDETVRIDIVRRRGGVKSFAPEQSILEAKSVEPITIRTLLQRAGTEAGRDIHGENVWVDLAMSRYLYLSHANKLREEARKALAKLSDHVQGSIEDYECYIEPCKIAVFTDVRFPNEADAIIKYGGEVWRVVGPDEDTGDHASEQVLDEALITHTIDNTIRDDDFEYLDQQLNDIIYGGES